MLERPELAEQFARTLVMHGGAVVGDGTYEDLRSNSPWMKQLLPPAGLTPERIAA
ncbi:MAG: hypothetical protein M5U09_17525 [Gammaproteobacteria bacterium]|nr:hypothetical protein [Gammaproteobacteria bacterium]